MRYPIAIVSTFLFCSPIFAAENKSERYSIDTAATIYASLQALDGYDKIIKDGSTEKTAKEYYKLGGGLRMLIARDEAKLRAVLVEFDAAKRALIAESAGNKSDDKGAALNAKIQQMAATEQSIDLAHISIKELKLDENPIPASVLAGLTLILDD